LVLEEEVPEDILAKHGQIYYKYKFQLEDGRTFKFGAMLEDVDESLRDDVQWVASKLKVFLQDLAIDIHREFY
jgi:hypothetical protein